MTKRPSYMKDIGDGHRVLPRDEGPNTMSLSISIARPGPSCVAVSSAPRAIPLCVGDLITVEQLLGHGTDGRTDWMLRFGEVVAAAGAGVVSVRFDEGDEASMPAFASTATHMEFGVQHISLQAH